MHRMNVSRAAMSAATRGRRPRTARGALIVAVLALALCASIATAAGPAAAAAPTFKDVPSSGELHDAVSFLGGTGAASGYVDGTFGISRVLTRGQSAKILTILHGVLIPAKTTGQFTDTDAIFGVYAEAAAAKGWVTGYPDGTFRARETLQRQHLAVIVVRSLGWEADATALSAAAVRDALKEFGDTGQINPANAPYVALAVSRGLFQGDGAGHFQPVAGITRAQFALVVYRAELRGLAVVQGVRANGAYPDGSPDRTRIVFDLSHAPGVLKVDPSHPGTLVIDVGNAYVAGDNGLRVKTGTAEVETVAARQTSLRPQSTRITLTLVRYSRFEVTVLAPSAAEGRGDRLLIDVFKRPPGPGGDGPPLVVLDPGHGGADSGAVGVTGTYEKTVNLAMTLFADEYLRQAGLRTALTRTTDVLPSLADRANLANNVGATIFVSIHNNAASGADSDGTYTFYWGTAGAEYSVEGKRLAECIQSAVVEELGSDDRGARTWWGTLYVLNHTDMPSALVEVGFLSNPAEEAKLKDPAYQRKAGRGIAEGIMEYLGWTYQLID